jgi:uncharacterized protein (DUF983 family)
MRMSNPWDDLEPVAEGEEADERSADPASRPHRRGRPGAFTVFARGAKRRCPRCGSSDLFVSWFKIRERCPRCGLRLEREEGGFLGAMAIGYGATATVWLMLLVVWLLIDLPDLHVPALTITSLAVVGVFPLLFWPFTKTIWAAIDHLADRTAPDYASREAADRAGGNGGTRGRESLD